MKKSLINWSSEMFHGNKGVHVMRMDITVFQIFIRGGISLYIQSEIMFCGSTYK